MSNNSTSPTPIRCYAHFHMTAPEYAVWDVCRSLSYQSGILYFNGRGIAARFESMAKSTAYELAASLAKKGWLKLVRDSRRRNNGTFSPRQYTVLSHAEWAAEHPDGCDRYADIILDELDKDSDVAVRYQGPDENSPVRHMDSPVRHMDQPVRYQGHNLKTTTETNPPTKEPDNQITGPYGGLDAFVQRFSGKKARQRRSAAATNTERRPVPNTGQAVRDTQGEAEWLSVAVTNMLGITLPDERSKWAEGIKAVLDKGYSREVVSDVVSFAYPRLKPGTMQNEGPARFAEFFDQMHQGWQNVTAPTATVTGKESK